VAPEPEGSSPHSQQAANGPYPEPGESTPHSLTNLPKVHFDPILLSTPCSSKWSPSLGLSHQNPVHVSPLSMRATCLAHLILLDLICLTMSGDKYKLWRSPLCNFLHCPVTSSLLDQNIPLSTLFSKTLSQCSSLNVRDQVSHPYKTTGRIMILYILTFTFLNSRREHRRLWTAWSWAFPDFSLPEHYYIYKKASFITLFTISTISCMLGKTYFTPIGLDAIEFHLVSVCFSNSPTHLSISITLLILPLKTLFFLDIWTNRIAAIAYRFHTIVTNA
jgi:hypothetical protein